MSDHKKVFPFDKIVGQFIESYTPVVGRITSSILKVPGTSTAAKLKRVRIVVGTTGNYTLRDCNMSGSVVMALTAGVEYMFPVGEVSVAAGTVTIIHDGELELQDQ